MRNPISLFVVLSCMAFVMVTSCSKDDPAPAAPAFSQAGIAGTWKITISEGTEWEEGVGIITPRAPEPDLLNGTLKITGTEVEIRNSAGTLFGTSPITVDAAGMKVIITDVGTFNVSAYVGNVSMYWAQVEPSVHADYEENNPGQFLYFQKFWTMTKNP